jgi:glycogen(starch) synthase
VHSLMANITVPKLRILMLSWEFPPHVVGGLGAHVAALVPALARAGVEVHLVTPRWAGGQSVEEIAATPLVPGDGRLPARTKTRSSSPDTVPVPAIVHRVDPPNTLSDSFFANTQRTNESLERQARLLYEDCGHFDLIHAHDWLVEFAAASLKHAYKTPLLATVHATERGRGRGHLSGDASEAIDRVEWQLTYEAWRVICASHYMAEEVRAFFNVPPDKVDVVPNGVDTAPFDALEQTDLSSFRALWAKDEQPIIFSVGRLVHEKGAHLIVEAAPRVLAKVPEAKFIIAGTGGMSDHLKRRVWELGVSNQVMIAGFISDPDRNRLLKVADVAVFPSLYEPFGIVALEAMAAKCPVVVSAVGGLAEVVDPGVTGLAVRPGDVDSLVWGIVETLEYPEAARSRAKAAYRVVRDEYNWDRIAQETIQVYNRVVRERQKVNW